MGAQVTGETLSSGWDRTFLDLSTKLAEPLCAAFGILGYRLIAPLEPNVFENCTTSVHEIALRALILCAVGIAVKACMHWPLVSLCVTASLLIGWVTLRTVGFALQGARGYSAIHFRNAEQSFDAQNPQLKILTWNICSFAGRLSLSFGGMNPWQTRVDALVEKMRAENPDVIILQEVFDVALAEVLIKKLKDVYPHFYTHLGPNPLCLTSGQMVITRCIPHSFSFTSFTNNGGAMHRGFAALELKAQPEDSQSSLRIITMHLDAEDQNKRIVQGKQIKAKQEELSVLATVCVGDLNTEPGQLSTVLDGCCVIPSAARKPTCTNAFTYKWKGKVTGPMEETIDHILVCQNAHSARIGVKYLPSIKAIDPTTNKPISDHDGVVALIVGINANFSSPQSSRL